VVTSNLEIFCNVKGPKPGSIGALVNHRVEHVVQPETQENWSAEEVALGPPAVVTWTSSTSGPSTPGEVAVIDPSPLTVKAARLPPKLTDIALENPVLLTTTDDPPEMGQPFGLTPVTTGAALATRNTWNPMRGEPDPVALEPVPGRCPNHPTFRRQGGEIVVINDSHFCAQFHERDQSAARLDFVVIQKATTPSETVVRTGVPSTVATAWRAPAGNLTSIRSRSDSTGRI
jgi:hypothetical protein